MATSWGLSNGARTVITVAVLAAVLLSLGDGAGAAPQGVLRKSAWGHLPAESTGLRTDIGDVWQTVRMRVTAYCPCPKCCGKYSDGITASGHKIRPGDTFVAADRRYPFGTKMLIPGYNNSMPVEVLDRGGAITGERLDVFFGTHKEALQWGVQYLDVEVHRK